MSGIRIFASLATICRKLDVDPGDVRSMKITPKSLVIVVYLKRRGKKYLVGGEPATEARMYTAFNDGNYFPIRSDKDRLLTEDEAHFLWLREQMPEFGHACGLMKITRAQGKRLQASAIKKLIAAGPQSVRSTSLD